MSYIVSFALLIVAVISPKLYTQGRLLWSLESSNVPAALQRRQAPYVFNWKLSDKVRNCEDLVLDKASGYAILSCDPTRDIWNTVMGVYNNHDTTEGGLYLYDYANRHSTNEELKQIKLMDYPDAGKDFHPLGIEYHAPSNRIFVVNLSKGRTRIEVFKLHLAESAATFIQSVRHVHLPSPNSIHAISENELYVTNDHYFPNRQNYILNQIETFGALPISSIDKVTFSGSKVEVQTMARQPFPNGIAKLNDTSFAVSSTSSGSVRIYHVDEKSGKWTQKESIDVPMMPDNLSVDDQGTLFITGHAHPTSIISYAKTRAECNSAQGRQTEKCKTATSPSMVLSWTRHGGLKDIYTDDKYGAACTAVRDAEAKIGIVSSLYDRGLLVWKEY
ncbi:Guanine nucleotide-exchange factor SEC12 [Elsinoe australis]|uniref:Guanine nucleotide-exchange factor SEC12 n=1 Tax=Elsinoe australis TaxID=40998 RepID=A0A2P8AJJ9_9PEZI|nr:Guanine nucleotide-exchange factor SEC12 [Elsinoe australis]